MDDNNFNQVDLDFQKMNATLADPDFANWYYNKMVNKSSDDVSIGDFIEIVKNYPQNKFE